MLLSSTAFGHRAIFHRMVRDRGIFLYRPIVALGDNEEPGALSVSRDNPQSGFFAPSPQCQAAVTRLAASRRHEYLRCKAAAAGRRIVRDTT
jgi:hypothetical protein